MRYRLVAIRVSPSRKLVNHGIIKAGFREPWLKRKEAENELDQAPLPVPDLRFGDEHLIAGAVRRTRQSISNGNQTHSYGRCLGRIFGPPELRFRLVAWTHKTRSGKQQQCSGPDHN